MEAKVKPKIIPMWISGFEQLMPEGRSFPSKYFPRPGAQLSITFGEPIPPSVLLDALDLSQVEPPTELPRVYLDSPSSRVDCADKKLSSHHSTTAIARAKVTSILHDYVEALGHQISGDLLGGPTCSKSSAN
jgi:monolysocardiolipin acyltransferase